VDHQAVLQRIQEHVGNAGTVTEPLAQQAHLVDERRLYQGEAALIVRPDSVEQVAAIMALCHQHRIGVVPQGGNTGYCGGATPFDANNQIVVCLDRLNRVREVDAVSFTMTVEAGLVLSKAQAVAAEHGLLFPLSMGSEGSCQIGGNLSTNAGGLAVLRYGTARELALGLEVVLPDGRILSELKGLRKDNTGYPLTQLFMGAEGTLGIITAAVLKLFPSAAATETAWLAVADIEAACRLLGVARQASGDALSSFEYVSGASAALVLDNVAGTRAPLDEPYEHYVLLEFTSPDSGGGLREGMERVLEVGMERGWVVDGVLAESGPQRDALWRIRESIPEAEKHSGGAIKHDVSVAIGRIPEFTARLAAELQAIAAYRPSVYGHIGDGNLHYNLLAASDQDAEAFKQGAGQRLSHAVHELAVGMGGSFSAEHGIGILKAPDLAEYTSPVALEMMKTVKQALDPHGIMNPGKILSSV
jgi:FAD/FMN-containing dehydrogenase